MGRIAWFDGKARKMVGDQAGFDTQIGRMQKVPHDDWGFNNISNILRYLYENPPYHNRQCGLTSGVRHTDLCLQKARQTPAAVLRAPVLPFTRGKSIPGVIYGVLLWADMNGATPLGAWGCSFTLEGPAALHVDARAVRVRRHHADEQDGTAIPKSYIA